MTNMTNASFKLGKEYFDEMWNNVVNGFGRRYDSDNPFRSLNITDLAGNVLCVNELCRGLGLIWVRDAEDTVLYGRERTLDTVAQCVNDWGVNGDYVQRGFNAAITRQRSEETERKERNTLARMQNRNKLLHTVAGDYPSLRNWGAPTEIVLFWEEEINGLRCGPK